MLGQQTTTIYEIVDYDLFDNKVFVILWKDAAGNVGRYYDGFDLPLARGFYCRTYKNKMYTVEHSILYFSAIGNAGDWSGMAPPKPTNFIDLSMGDCDMTDTVALEVYYDKLAIFSRPQCSCGSWIQTSPRTSTCRPCARPAPPPGAASCSTAPAM